MRFSEAKEPTPRWAGRSGLAIAAAAALFCLSAPANALLTGLGGAQLRDATWNNTGPSFGDPIYWTPNTDIPNNIATFSDAVPFSTVSFPNFPWLVQTLNFTSTAGAYTFATSTGNSIAFGGIINASANVQTFNIINGGFIGFADAANLPTGITINVWDGELRFENQASAGNATINIGSTAGVRVEFYDNSSAGNATITNDNTLSFFGNSTAANANITNNRYLQFFENTSAGNAAITNNDNASFFDNSTAGTSTITNISVLAFYGNSTAAFATITNWGLVSFNDSSTAGNATFANMPTRLIEFNNNATAANASFVNDGIINFNDASTAANATFVNAFSATMNFNSFSSTIFSTAANAKFENYGSIVFNGYSTAGNATITNDGALDFYNNATAANATITNNSYMSFSGTSTAGSATITNNCCLTFYDDSTAGNAKIYNFGSVYFDNQSNAGNATITNQDLAQIFFTGVATAANATITNSEFGYIAFADSSTAGSATIRNSGIIEFSGNTNAGTANILITPTGAVAFFGSANADNAVIVNNSAQPIGLLFADNANAQNATITTTAGAYTLFIDNATGGNARFITTGNGVVDFSEPFGPGFRSAGSIEGTGVFIIGGTFFTVGSNNLSTTLNGIIVDSYGCGCANPAGSLIKTGTGTLTLNGINTYTGFTDIAQGGLIINGSITSTTFLYTGALLGGRGTIFGDLYTQPSSTIAPGDLNSVGTLNVTGISVMSGITFQMDVTSSARNDRMVSADQATVSGTIVVSGLNFQGVPNGARLPVVTSVTGVTGQFSSVTDNLLFYDTSLDADPNNLYVVFTRNAQTVSPYALTPNQRAVAAAIDAGNNGVYAAFQNSPEAVRAALDLLSGEVYATMSGIFIDESSIFKNAIFARLRNTAFSGFSGPIGYLSENDEQALAYTRANRNNPFRALRPADRGYEYWAQAFGSWAKYNSDSNAGTAKRSTGGLVAGLDKMLEDGIRAGLSLGYSNTTARIENRASKANSDTLQLAAYLSKLHGNWSYRAGATLAVHNVNSERYIGADIAQADYFALTGQIFGEVGYAMTAGSFALEPFANVALVHNYQDGFTETGSNAALIVDSTNRTLAVSTAGLRVATRYNLSNGWTLAPRTTIGWQHTYGNLTPAATLTFQSTGTGMTIAGTPLSRNMLLTETGFDVRMSAREMLGFYYSATIANDSTEHAVRGKYEWRF